MVWLSDAWREILAALGVRRYVISGIVTLVLGVAGAISLHVTGTAMSPQTHAFLALIVVLGFLFFCVLNRAITLRRQATPSIKVFLDKTHNGVEEFHMSNGTTAKYIQVSVCSETKSPLYECQVRLQKVERVCDDGTFESLLNESLTCDWSKTPVDAIKRATIQTDDVVRANLFFVQASAPKTLQQSLVGGDMKLFNHMQPKGKYRLTIRASAQGISAAPKQFVLDWGGSFDAISMEEVT
jgi:hypothetical protein